MAKVISDDGLPYGFVRAFHLMAKPVGSVCNLDCTYCYYLHKEQLLAEDATFEIPDDLLELYIRQYIESQDIQTVRFSWHGGEPTLMGLQFFEKIVRLQHLYASGKTIINDIQTNGTLLDDGWCEFFKKHRFIVGLSIDGPRYLHDEYRLSKSGKPTFDEVINAFRLLKHHKVQFNTLTVINRLSAKHPDEVYDFLTKELGSRFVQLLPCVEPKDFCSVAPQHWDVQTIPSAGTTGARPGNSDSIVTEWSVEPDDWGQFLCRVFDLWAKQDAGIVRVNWFESVIAQCKGLPPLMCVTADVCGRSLAMERDGSVYSCDHYVYPEFKIGNIKEMPLSAMAYSASQRRFGWNKRETLPAYCRTCEVLPQCNGECPKNRMINAPDGTPGLNYLCAGFKRFFTHATPRLRELAGRLEVRSASAANPTFWQPECKKPDDHPNSTR
jgi:uncharacterized protein